MHTFSGGSAIFVVLASYRCKEDLKVSEMRNWQLQLRVCGVFVCVWLCVCVCVRINSVRMATAAGGCRWRQLSKLQFPWSILDWIEIACVGLVSQETVTRSTPVITTASASNMWWRRGREETLRHFSSSFMESYMGGSIIKPYVRQV